MEARFEQIINIAKNAYISVYGANKWNSLTKQEQHDAIMFMLTNFKQAMEA